MKLICTMPVRNEDWCLGLTARAALMWCDELIIGLHACSDKSGVIAADIAEEYPERVWRVFQQESEWAEMSQRQRLLLHARHRGATHIAIVDADEILTGNLLPRIRDIIEMHTHDGSILNLPWLALARDPSRYIAGTSYWGAGRQNVTMAFSDKPAYHWATRNGYDFHQRPPLGRPPKFAVPGFGAVNGGLMHLQFLSERRLRAKQQLYIQTELIRWPGRTPKETLNQMYGRAVYDSNPTARGVTTKPTPAEWWTPYEHLIKYLELDENKVPWQELAVRENIAKYGAEFFTGVDTFGLY